MKKILAILSALMIVLGLCACNSNEKETNEEDNGFLNGIFSSDEKDDEDKTTTTIAAEEASHLAEKIEKGRFDSFDGYSDEDKKKIQEYAEKDGYTLEYNEDGSGTLSNEEGQWFVGKGWVDNEYTNGVPAIDFGTITMSSEMDEKEETFYIFLVKETSAYTTMDYIEELLQAGFAEVGENERDPDVGVVTFIGENEEGKRVEVAYSSNGLTVKILLSK